MTEIISSHSNPLVKQIRALRQKKARDESDLFLVEGIHHVGEVVDAGWEVQTLVVAPDQLKSGFAVQLVEAQSRGGVRCVAFSTELFETITGKDNPQGLLAIVRQRHFSLATLAAEKIRLAVALVSPQDPGNVGAILRTLDAVAGDALFLLEGGVDLYHPSVVRASMGALFWLPVAQAPFAAFIDWASVHGFQLIGSSAHARMDYRKVERGSRPLILLLGSEQKGLSPEQMESCELNVCLPMKGRASSLNLAVAAGILLYRFMEIN